MSSRLRPTARSSLRFQPELTTRAGQVGADLAALQAFDFELQPAVLGILHHHAADAGDLLQALLHLARVRPAVGAIRLRARRLRRRAAGWSGSPPNRCATSLPWLMMMTRSQECSTSDRMWVLRMMVWSPASALEQFADFDDLLGVEAGGGLVEDQDVGVVDDRLGEADALPVAFGELADQLVADVADGAAPDHFVDAPVDIGGGDALQLADEGEVLGDLHFGVDRRRFRQVADALLDLHAGSPARRSRRRWPCPAVGGRKQVRTRIVVVFPAPFGPRKPTICPFSTSKEMLSTATVRAYRLVRPSTLIILCMSQIRQTCLVAIWAQEAHVK